MQYPNQLSLQIVKDHWIDRGLKNFLMLLVLLYWKYKTVSSLFILQEMSCHDMLPVCTLTDVTLIAACYGLMLNDYFLLLPLVVAMVYEVVASTVKEALMVNFMYNDSVSFELSYELVLSFSEAYATKMRKGLIWAIAKEACIFSFCLITMLVAVILIYESVRKERELQEAPLQLQVARSTQCTQTDTIDVERVDTDKQTRLEQRTEEEPLANEELEESDRNSSIRNAQSLKSQDRLTELKSIFNITRCEQAFYDFRQLIARGLAKRTPDRHEYQPVIVDEDDDCLRGSVVVVHVPTLDHLGILHRILGPRKHRSSHTQRSTTPGVPLTALVQFWSSQDASNFAATSWLPHLADFNHQTLQKYWPNSVETYKTGTKKVLVVGIAPAILKDADDLDYVLGPLNALRYDLMPNGDVLMYFATRKDADCAARLLGGMELQGSLISTTNVMRSV